MNNDEKKPVEQPIPAKPKVDKTSLEINKTIKGKAIANNEIIQKNETDH